MEQKGGEAETVLKEDESWRFQKEQDGSFERMKEPISPDVLSLSDFLQND